MRNTNFLKTLVVAVCLFIGYAANASIYPYNDFKIEKKSSESEYQEYVGKTIVFYEPVTSKERNFKLDRITFGVPYTIESITVKGYSYDAIVTFAVKKVGNPKAKVVKFKCENGVAASWDASVYDIPAYLTDKMQDFKDKYIGKKLGVSGKECTISDIVMEPKYFSEILGSVYKDDNEVFVKKVNGFLEYMGEENYINVRTGEGHTTQWYKDGYRVSWDTKDGGRTERAHWTNQNVSKRKPNERHKAPDDSNL